MAKVVNIRKAIATALKAVHERVYYEQAPDDTAYPYLIYDLPDSVDDGSLEQFVLDVDGWDMPKGGDTTALETLMDSVNKALDGLTVSVDNLSIIVHLDNRLSLKDDNPLIKRRTYVYEIRTYEGR